SEDSEANLMDTFNRIVNGFDSLNRVTFIQDFRGTYSFIDEVNGTKGTSIDFINDSYQSTANAYAIILQSEDAYNKVLQFFDDGAADLIDLSHKFTAGAQTTTGTIEYWMKISDVTQTVECDLFNTGKTKSGPAWFIAADKIQYDYAGGPYDATGGAVTDDIWMHIKFLFDIVAQTYDFHLNEVLLDADIPFQSAAVTELEYLYFFKSSATHIVYYDAIGFSWDSDYTIGDNYPAYSKPSVLVYITLKYSNIAFENGKTKRWYQDIYLDVEWSTE
ncbi:hypothetical protein LCGC14_2764990, partial [marine sediment metagenome]